MTQHRAITGVAIVLAITLSASLPLDRCWGDQTPQSVVAEQVPLLADKNQASDASRKLQSLGPAAVPALVAALDQPNQNLRCGALDVLGKIGDPSALPVLSKIASSDDPLSGVARQAIANIGGPDAATCLIDRLKAHINGDEASLMADDLGAIGDNRAIEPLIQLLQGELIRQPKVQDGASENNKIWAREGAARALRHFRDPRARAALKRAVAEDADWDVYFAAKEALRRMEQTGHRGDAWPIARGDWRDLVPLAVVKQPEPPGGAEAAVRQWQAENAGKMTQWSGPNVLDYAAAVDIARARAELVDDAKNGQWTSEIVETLMCYLRNIMIWYGPDEAKDLILQIGAPAIPSLEIGQKRGDVVLKRHCQECLEAIRSQAATQPAK